MLTALQIPGLNPKTRSRACKAYMMRICCVTVVLNKEYEKGHERLEDKLRAGILRRCRVMRLIDRVIDMLMVSENSKADGANMPSSFIEAA